MHRPERRGTAPDLFALVMLAFSNNARKVPARRPWQSCLLEVSGDVPDVARIDRCSLYVNKCFTLRWLGNRKFFNPQHGRRTEHSKAQRLDCVSTHSAPLKTQPKLLIPRDRLRRVLLTFGGPSGPWSLP